MEGLNAINTAACAPPPAHAVPPVICAAFGSRTGVQISIFFVSHKIPWEIYKTLARSHIEYFGIPVHADSWPADVLPGEKNMFLMPLGISCKEWGHPGRPTTCFRPLKITRPLKNLQLTMTFSRPPRIHQPGMGRWTMYKMRDGTLKLMTPFFDCALVDGLTWRVIVFGALGEEHWSQYGGNATNALPPTQALIARNFPRIPHPYSINSAHNKSFGHNSQNSKPLE